MISKKDALDSLERQYELFKKWAEERNGTPCVLSSDHEDIRQYINQSPTSEEVCKALSEYYDGNKVKYLSDIRKFAVLGHDGYQEIVFNDIDNNLTYFRKPLTPHLITMIGQFYEELSNNEK